MGVNSNFIANAGWGVQNATGQALTMGISPTSTTDASGVTTYTGWGPVIINDVASAGNNLASISPAVTYTAKGTTYGGVAFFINFVRLNPIHVTKINVRASSLGVLPTNIVVLTPNVFTGQFDRQVINVTADTTMYQNQSNIVTITGLDIFIARDSIIEFGGGFSESTQPSLSLDVTIDKYLSLEKSLYENMGLLATATGQMQDFNNIANNAAAKINNQVVQGGVQSEEVNAAAARTIGQAILNRKGLNSAGNR